MGSNNPSGVIKSVPAYIKKKTRGGQQIVDEMLAIAFGRKGTDDTPTYSIKERWQALKWLGDHMDEGPDFGDGPEKGKIYLVDYSKVKSGT